ncbi:hypothetical protein SLNWT_4248 [Streptomyces albus]|uniref:Uncharacterized protein n=1 Tax=Streptomyces albus (strain ATCC 21838 / DSM 41398 / FERM P-419 / JCM 4703 / NBRC 107858) TaxID=1081613 RepID=A0A0B5ESG6_STRA4|nr:hypothetical protein SLNWT_4248 [Streptomyces albus]
MSRARPRSGFAAPVGRSCRAGEGGVPRARYLRPCAGRLPRTGDKE